MHIVAPLASISYYICYTFSVAFREIGIGYSEASKRADLRVLFISMMSEEANKRAPILDRNQDKAKRRRIDTKSAERWDSLFQTDLQERMKPTETSSDDTPHPRTNEYCTRTDIDASIDGHPEITEQREREGSTTRRGEEGQASQQTRERYHQ